MPRPHPCLSALLLAALAATITACAASTSPGRATPSPTAAASTDAAVTGPAAATFAPLAAPSPPAISPSSTPIPSSTPDARTAIAPDGAAATVVAIHVESRVADHPTPAFRDEVAGILGDVRGWERAGYAFVLDASVPPYRLVLAEADEVDDLCLPLDTEGTWSCQNGPVVALNADRWRTATDSWTGTLAQYRAMLVNHEVGHLLHLHHPQPQCPGFGLPAPVMAQQSASLSGCEANSWPLQWEVDLAAAQAEPLAPPADHDTREHQPSPPPATS